MSKIDPRHAQPETLARFAEAARETGGKVEKPGLHSDKDTTAIPTEPKLKQDAARKVLLEGVTHHDHGAKEAIDRLPDRIAKK